MGAYEWGLMDRHLEQSEYIFGEVVLNVDRRDLVTNGVAQEVEPRVFDLLVYLIRNQSRVVPKSELQEAVWKPAIVTDTALTRAVMKARRAVGDDPAEQLIIKTVRGHGYRFVAELEVADVPESKADMDYGAAVPAAPAADDVPSRSRQSRVIAMATALVAVLVIGAIFNRYYRSPEFALPSGARVAVLPFVDNTADPELQWASLGLMSYAGKLLESSGSLATVSATRVMGLVEGLNWQGETSGQSAAAVIDKLRTAYGASHVVVATLYRQGQLLRVQTQVIGPDDQWTEYTAVGEEGTDVTRSVVREVSAQILGRRRAQGDEVVAISTSDFVNEAYARGLKLELEGRCEEALELYSVALQQEPDSVALRLQFAGCARIQGDWEKAETMSRELQRELASRGDSVELARTHSQLGIILNRTGRVSDAVIEYESALSVARRLGDEDLSGDILTNWAIIAKSRGDLDQAEQLLSRAIVAYTAAGRARPGGSVYSGLANIAMESRNLDEADAFLDQAIASFQEVGDRRREAMMINNRGLLRRHQGRYSEAAVLHEQSLEIRQEIGDEVGVGRILGMLSGLYLDLGQYRSARESALRALPIARAAQDTLFEGTALVELGMAQERLGQHDAARESYLAAQAVLAGMEDQPRILETELRLAELDRREGQSERARQRMQSALHEATAGGHELARLRALNYLARMDKDANDPQSAIQKYREVIAGLKDRDWTGLEATAVTGLATLYLDMDELDLAEPLIGQVSQHAGSFSGLLIQARYSAIRGQFEQAASLMREAKDLAGERWTTRHDEILAGYTDTDSRI